MLIEGVCRGAPCTYTYILVSLGLSCGNTCWIYGETETLCAFSRQKRRNAAENGRKQSRMFPAFSPSSFLLFLLLNSALIRSLCIERSPAYRITQLCATFICHCWIVVVVTTGNTFHNGLKQSLWKQSFLICYL